MEEGVSGFSSTHRSGGANVINPSLGSGEDRGLSSDRQEAKRGELFLPLALSFSMQAFNTIDCAHSHWGGQAILLSLPIQMLISSRSTLTDKPRNNV